MLGGLRLTKRNHPKQQASDRQLMNYHNET